MELKGTLGFLGFGNMGGAIVRGLLSSGTTSPDRVMVYDIDAEKCAVAAALDIRAAADPLALVRWSDTLVLAVKPQTMTEALAQIGPGITPRTLVISIAAGVSIDYIKDRLGMDVRVVRVMPNTPALVLAGAAGIALSKNCTEDDATATRTIFEAVGIAEMVPEAMIDVVTALSGSGPAYFFYMVECLVAAAAAHGLSEDQALRLAAQTLLGAGRLLTETHECPSTLRQRVTSKGGTTEAAINAFSAGRLDTIVAQGVGAAVARAHELGR